MKPFTTCTARTVSMPENDIDTDIIFPARFLLITERKGLGRYAFFERRYDVERRDAVDFALREGAGILIAGVNFGCGSSLEQAVWALDDLGIRCIIAPSFGEIFCGNCVKNGILPIVLGGRALARLRADAGTELTVDLLARRILCPHGELISFDIEDWQRQPLLNGWDETTTILGLRVVDINSFERRQRETQPWLWRSRTSQERVPNG